MTLDFRAYAQSLDLARYPRTPHLEGSRLQDGDEGDAHIPYRALAGTHIVVEEKLDGANTGISFSAAGELLLQSRGHYLAGGGRERQFSFVKAWASAHADWLLERLGDRYVMYGETMSKKHAVFSTTRCRITSSNSTCWTASPADSCRRRPAARCSRAARCCRCRSCTKASRRPGSRI